MGLEEWDRGGSDLNRRQGVRIDKLLLDRADGRRDVRAIEGETEYGERETHLRIDECAYVAANNGGVEPPWPIGDSGDAGIDEAGCGQAYGGINLALGGFGPPDSAGATIEPADDVRIDTAPANEGLQGMIVSVDEPRHDDHPAPVDHGYSRRLREVHPHVRNCVLHNEHVNVLELSEDALVSEARIHGEHERGVPNQIARLRELDIARSHDPDNQCQHDPDVRASHVCTPSVVELHRRQNMPASMFTSQRRSTAEPQDLGVSLLALACEARCARPCSGRLVPCRCDRAIPTRRTLGRALWGRVFLANLIREVAVANEH